MERRSYALATGLFLIALLVVGGAIFWWMSRADVEYQPYEIVTEEHVNGLTPNSTVYLRGVAVGKVVSIGFDPDDLRYIRIRIEVDDSIELPANVYATLNSQGVTGLARIVLDADSSNSDANVGSNYAVLKTSEANPAVIPLRPGLFDRLLSKGEALVSDASAVMGNLAEITSDDNTRKVTQLLDNLNTASAQFIELELEMKGLPTLAKSTLLKSQITFAEAETFIQNLNGLNTKIERFVRNADIMARRSTVLIEEVDAVALPRIYESLDDISLAARDVRRLAQSLDQNPQALIFGGEEVEPGPGEPGFNQ